MAKSTTVRLPDTIHYRMQQHCSRNQITQQKLLNELLDDSLPAYDAEIKEAIRKGVLQDHPNGAIL